MRSSERSDEPIRVGVGSRNPVKVAAVETALDGRWAATVEGVAVESGVAEQPFGERETITGAKNRARRAHEAGYDIGVGLEGGVAEVPGADGVFLIMWAAATDGDRTGLGAGPRLQLPGAIAARIQAGEELGPVMNDVVGESNVAENQGAAGVLTAGLLDREDALASAVAGALGPFVSAEY